MQIQIRSDNLNTIILKSKNLKTQNQIKHEYDYIIADVTSFIDRFLCKPLFMSLPAFDDHCPSCLEMTGRSAQSDYSLQLG